MQEKNRSVFHLQFPTLFVVISTHMQRGIKTGVKSCSQRRILPLRSEYLTPRLEAQHRRLNAAQDVGRIFPGYYGHCYRTAICILVGKTFFYFLILYNYPVDSRILCNTQIFTSVTCNLLHSKRHMGKRCR